MIGYVVMPEHIHLPVSEPETKPLATALQALKQSVSRTLALRNAEPFWPARYYDFNVWTEKSTSRNCATSIGIQWCVDWLSDRKTGSGPASATAQPARKVLSRLSPDGPPVSAKACNSYQRSARGQKTDNPAPAKLGRCT